MTAAFAVPPALSATEPPEARGLARDEVRLLVAAAGRPLRHLRFREIAGALAPGDLLVVNTSDTAPAAVDGRRADGRPVVVHVSGPDPAAAAGTGPAHHVVELRTPDGARVGDGVAGERIALPGGSATLLAAYPDPVDGERGPASGRHASRLWRASLPAAGGVAAWLDRVGRPIRYGYLRGDWPVSAYRTVFARRAGTGGTGAPDTEMPSAEMPSAEMPSAEMPSAGRPFTRRVLDALATRGVDVVEVVLHTGVSSLEAGETPLPERFRVPAATARAVAVTRARGRRVIAVGTTVTRALEAATTGTGAGARVEPAAGWTDLVLGPDRPARVVDGLVTGWHEPDASHLLLLEAVAGPRLVQRAYAAALAEGYRWHEFGDSCLLLPARPPRML